MRKLPFLCGPQIAATLVLGLTLVGHPAFARGHESSGGGDPYTLDFLVTATQKLFPWLIENGAKLSPPVDAFQFLKAVDPGLIESRPQVYESCDDTQNGREVMSCFNAQTGQTLLSRKLYPLEIFSPGKARTIAHEVFRKMGLENDDYAVSKQMTYGFDETFDGQGDETPWGIESCWMEVQTTGPTLILRMHALNQEVMTIVPEAPEGKETRFEVQMKAASGKDRSLKIKASGRLKDSRPIEYRMEITPNSPLLGNEKESIHCRFKSSS